MNQRGGAGGRAPQRESTRGAQGGASPRAPYNILFLLTDQERFFRPCELPADHSRPAHERLMGQGTTFTNHRIALIDEEVGEDRGRMFPGGLEAGWEFSAATMAP